MKKLTIEHLAPYLPYKLILLQEDIIDGYEEKYSEMVGLGEMGVTTDLISFIEYEFIKPILHPLSEYCGKIIAKDVMNKLNCDLDTVHEIWDLQGGDIILDKISYKTYIILCKNHVDFNDLIKDNLAINKNEL